MKCLIEFINEAAKKGKYITRINDATEIEIRERHGGFAITIDVSDKVKKTDSEGISWGDVTLQIANYNSEYAWKNRFTSNNVKKISIIIENSKATKPKYMIGIKTDGLETIAHGILTNDNGKLTGNVSCDDKEGVEVFKIFAKQLKNLSIEE